MGIVCGWIVLVWVIIRFFQTWLLWMLPPLLSVIFSGVLELTNGCCLLNQIVNEQLRFILCSTLLSLGGLCVTMQTAAVSKGLSMIKYVQGKLLQAAFSFIFSLPAGPLLFSVGAHPAALILYISALCVFPLLLFYFKKTIAFQRQMIYNTARP